MKKILSVFIILIMIIGITGSVYAENGFNVSIQKESISNGELTVSVKIANIQSERGIIAFGGTLQYDKNVLNFVEMTGGDSWGSPSYNEENGKFVIERNRPTTTDEIAVRIKFEIKDTSAESTQITLTSLSAGDGDAPMEATDTSLITSLGSPSEPTPDEDEPEPTPNETEMPNQPTATPTPTQNVPTATPTANAPTPSNTPQATKTPSNTSKPIPTGNSKDEDVVNTKIPYAGGINTVIIIAISVVAGFGIIMFIKLKILNHRTKH